MEVQGHSPPRECMGGQPGSEAFGSNEGITTRRRKATGMCFSVSSLEWHFGWDSSLAEAS